MCGRPGSDGGPVPGMRAVDGVALFTYLALWCGGCNSLEQAIATRGTFASAKVHILGHVEACLERPKQGG